MFRSAVSRGDSNPALASEDLGSDTWQTLLPKVISKHWPTTRPESPRTAVFDCHFEIVVFGLIAQVVDGTKTNVAMSHLPCGQKRWPEITRSPSPFLPRLVHSQPIFLVKKCIHHL